MPRVPGSRFGPKEVFMISLVAIIIVYLWSIFTSPGTGICTAEDIVEERHDCVAIGQSFKQIEIVVPESEQLQGASLWIMKIFIMGTAVFLAYIIVMRFVGSRPSRRDMVSLIFMVVTIYFLWVYIIQPTNLLGATNFEQLNLDKIGQKAAQMLNIK